MKYPRRYRLIAYLCAAFEFKMLVHRFCSTTCPEIVPGCLKLPGSKNNCDAWARFHFKRIYHTDTWLLKSGAEFTQIGSCKRQAFQRYLHRYFSSFISCAGATCLPLGPCVITVYDVHRLLLAVTYPGKCMFLQREGLTTQVRRWQRSC